MTSDATPYIYADNAATTPLSPRALDAMMPYLTSRFGNPSGIHRISREASVALGEARLRMAGLLGARDASEVFFTSGGSESDTWALRGAVERFRDLHGGDARPRIITSAIEHHAILHCCDALAREGVDVELLPVDSEGFVDAADLRAALSHDAERVALVSIMLANNEVGTIQDIRELARIAHEHDVPFHTDAVQAVGHIPVDVDELGVDALSLSGHKFHGPRGTGVLYLRDGFSLPALIAGGGQERGVRGGTENLAGIIGMVAALEEALESLPKTTERIARLREQLVARIVESCEGVRATGPRDGSRRLPSIASFAIDDVDGELLVVLLDRAGVAAATGSACSTGSVGPSHVISALGISSPDSKRLLGSLRLSLADSATQADIDLLAERVPACIRRARLMSSMR